MVDVADGGTAAIARLRVRLARACAGEPIDSPVDRAFASVISRHALPHALPEALIDGLDWDARSVVLETFEDVLDYAARVAGSVGAMMAVLMGVRTEHLVARACDLGVAMQLTNIARDVGEDAAMGRLYLPRDWMREEGLDPDLWLRKPSFTPAIARVVARLLKAADDLYAKADPAIAALPASCRPAIFAARRIYHAIGVRVAERGYDSISMRARVSTAHKLRLLARATIDAILVPGMAATIPASRPVAFLVRAVTLTQPLPDRSIPVEGMTGRILWVAELFANLEERRRAPRAGRMMPLEGAGSPAE